MGVLYAVFFNHITMLNDVNAFQLCVVKITDTDIIVKVNRMFINTNVRKYSCTRIYNYGIEFDKNAHLIYALDSLLIEHLIGTA